MLWGFEQYDTLTMNEMYHYHLNPTLDWNVRRNLQKNEAIFVPKKFFFGKIWLRLHLKMKADEVETQLCILEHIEKIKMQKAKRINEYLTITWKTVLLIATITYILHEIIRWGFLADSFQSFFRSRQILYKFQIKN